MTAVRRRVRTLLAAPLSVAIALLIGGCGLVGGDPEPADGATRLVTGIDGVEVQVPVAPTRVVTLSEPTLDGALALGVTPIGTTAGRGQSGVPNYLADLAGGIPILGNVAQPNFEAIGDANPDLILVDGTSINNNPPVIELLRKIAPTVYVGYAGGDWRTTFGYTADALNLKDEGAQVIAEYDAHATEVTQQIGDRRAETFSIVRWQGSAPALILKELPPGVALTDLGLKRPANQNVTGRGHSEPVSLENLADIDADWMFFGTLGGSSVSNPGAGGASDAGESAKVLADAVSTPGFTLLNAYKNDHIVPVDGSVWTSTGGPILMNRIVDDVRAALAP